VRNFVAIEGQLPAISATLTDALRVVLGDDTGFWVAAEILPARVRTSPRASMTGKIEIGTRIAILDELRASGSWWHGSLDEVAFLQRIFDLHSLPSTDPRYEDAEGDIWQHCISNPDDWSPNWIFNDARFALHDGPQEKFLEFVCQVLHPVVRRDVSEQQRLVQAFNGHLAQDGWELVEDRVIDGRPTYVPEQRIHGIGTSIKRVQAVAAGMGADVLYQDLERLHRIGDTDPGAAIGIAKDLVESCCKYVLTERSVEFSEEAKLPELLKTSINIMPKEISEDARAANDIRDVLTSLGRIVHSLGPIRNAYGQGHGRRPDFKGLEPRHARLAIGAASTFVDFVLDRHSRLRGKAEFVPNSSGTPRVQG
jgi:hypothetical protein